MQKATSKTLSILAAWLAVSACAFASHYRSPWDGHNVPLNDAPYSCPGVVHLSRDLTTDGFYSDGKASVIDPAKWRAYAASSGPTKSSARM